MASAALLITVVTAASRVSGFAREAVLAGVFGASPELDAYLVAHQIPNVVIALLSTAVVTATIPALATRVAEGDEGGAHGLFRAITLWGRRAGSTGCGRWPDGSAPRQP